MCIYIPIFIEKYKNNLTVQHLKTACCRQDWIAFQKLRSQWQKCKIMDLLLGTHFCQNSKLSYYIEGFKYNLAHLFSTWGHDLACKSEAFDTFSVGSCLHSEFVICLTARLWSGLTDKKHISRVIFEIFFVRSREIT